MTGLLPNFVNLKPPLLHLNLHLLHLRRLSPTPWAWLTFFVVHVQPNYFWAIRDHHWKILLPLQWPKLCEKVNRSFQRYFSTLCQHPHTLARYLAETVGAMQKCIWCALYWKVVQGFQRCELFNENNRLPCRSLEAQSASIRDIHFSTVDWTVLELSTKSSARLSVDRWGYPCAGWVDVGSVAILLRHVQDLRATVPIRHVQDLRF